MSLVVLDTLFSDITTFETYVKNHNINDKFEAVIQISKKARLYQQAYPQLDEKEAMSWVLRGHPSKEYIKRYKRIQLNEKLASQKFDMLAYIDDDLVRTSCEKSIELSLKMHKPCFVYEDDLKPEDKPRVRIITKLTFDQENK